MLNVCNVEMGLESVIMKFDTISKSLVFVERHTTLSHTKDIVHKHAIHVRSPAKPVLSIGICIISYR